MSTRFLESSSLSPYTTPPRVDSLAQFFSWSVCVSSVQSYTLASSARDDLIMKRMGNDGDLIVEEAGYAGVASSVDDEEDDERRPLMTVSSATVRSSFSSMICIASLLFIYISLSLVDERKRERESEREERERKRSFQDFL